MNPFHSIRRTNPSRWRVNVAARRYVGRCDSCGTRTASGLGAVHTHGPAIGYRALYCPVCIATMRAGRHPAGLFPFAESTYGGPVRFRLFRPSDADIKSAADALRAVR